MSWYLHLSKKCFRVETLQQVFAMGLGWPPAWRIKISGSALCNTASKKTVAAAKRQKTLQIDPKVVVGDGPALFRMHTFRQCSALQVARQVAKRAMLHGSPNVVSILFDNAANMPPARSHVAVQRQGAALTDDERQQIDKFNLVPMVPGHLSVVMPWDIVFRDPAAKAAVWEIAAKAVFDVLCGYPGLTVEVVSAGATRVRVGTVELPTFSPCGYGEADIQVATRVADFAAARMDCLVATVDYDFYFQMIIAPEGKQCKFIQFKNDVVDVEVLRDMFSRHGRDSALSAAFFLLACFKSDYSKGISGPTKTAIAKMVGCMHAAGGGDKRVQVVEECKDDDGNCTLALFPKRLAPLLGRVTPEAAELVCKILWVLLYFGQYARGKTSCIAPPECVPPADLWALEIFKGRVTE